MISADLARYCRILHILQKPNSVIATYGQRMMGSLDALLLNTAGPTKVVSRNRKSARDNTN